MDDVKVTKTPAAPDEQPHLNITFTLDSKNQFDGCAEFALMSPVRAAELCVASAINVLAQLREYPRVLAAFPSLAAFVAYQTEQLKRAEYRLGWIASEIDDFDAECPDCGQVHG